MVPRRATCSEQRWSSVWRGALDCRRQVAGQGVGRWDNDKDKDRHWDNDKDRMLGQRQGIPGARRAPIAGRRSGERCRSVRTASSEKSKTSHEQAARQPRGQADSSGGRARQICLRLYIGFRQNRAVPVDFSHGDRNNCRFRVRDFFPRCVRRPKSQNSNTDISRLDTHSRQK